MKIILDTHCFLWAISDPERIRPELRREIETAANRVYLSSISIAELMIKSSIGKLEIDFDPISVVRDSGFELLEFSAADALQLVVPAIRILNQFSA